MTVWTERTTGTGLPSGRTGAVIRETDWVKSRTFGIPYWTKISIEGDFAEIFDKIMVDYREQCLIGALGCLPRHFDSGKVTRENIHGEIGVVCTGTLPGCRNDDETIVSWLPDAVDQRYHNWSHNAGKGQTSQYRPDPVLRMITLSIPSDINWET